jgi:hypothetical protein
VIVLPPICWSPHCQQCHQPTGWHFSAVVTPQTALAYRLAIWCTCVSPIYPKWPAMIYPGLWPERFNPCPGLKTYFFWKPQIRLHAESSPRKLLRTISTRWFVQQYLLNSNCLSIDISLHHKPRRQMVLSNWWNMLIDPHKFSWLTPW